MARSFRRRPRLRWVLLSLGLTLLVVLPLSAVILPGVHRQRMMQAVASDDPARRERGLNYVIRHAADDEDVCDAALEQLRTSPAVSALPLYAALIHAGVGADPRWTEALAEGATHYSHPEYLQAHALITALEGGKSPPLIDEAIRRLDGSGDKAFRDLVTLIDQAGEWSLSRVLLPAWTRWLSDLAQSSHPESRWLAATKLGDLPPGEIGNSEMLGTLLQNLQLLRQDAEDRVRRAAWFAAGAWSGFSPEAHRMLIEVVPGDSDTIARWCEAADTTPFSEVGAASEAPPPTLDQVRDSLTADDAYVRAIGCALAVRMLPKEDLDALTRDLLNDLDEINKQSGALLAGLTEHHVSLLKRRAEHASDETTRLTLKLGLWMQGEDESMEPLAGELLDRPGFPPATALLALLHRRDVRGWDRLLGPDGFTDSELCALLGPRRFGWVLQHVAPVDAPPFTIGTNRVNQLRQIAQLRVWYATHRHALTRPSTRP